MDIRRINLNLLIHFDTLMTELSVSKAAEKTFLTQTAMSYILKELRELFDDPLFIRKAHGLQPTQKALDLAPKIKTFLDSSKNIFQETTFDPFTEELSFKAILSVHGEFLILSKLCAYLSLNAPNFTLKTISLSEYVNLEHLLATEIDFAVGPAFLETGNNANAELLFFDEVVCVMGSSNPLVHQEITTEDFFNADHVEIQFSYLRKDNMLFKILAGFGKRKTKIIVPNLINVCEVISQTNCIAMMPRSLAVSLKNKYQFEIKPFPFPIKEYRIMIHYHKRLENDKRLRWIIDAIKNHCCQ
ncbi:LysR family transcriptional regulator [Legionella cincinnatiensis]|uniref:LysR family transcriptional regulator n=1 Tax=Legionella cincinnatiensis TaxID=28085 RepID=A0A378INJ1_9GAMM|nr:LysR family transcriptional regulator [Legionella cincinnatiensis]KTC92322.1 LysR family transcriptional regulator [Legionella cincinnatiensis]STX36797.1 LysR family transcriptional regulator [Legionella cincinnatiensis]